MEVTRSQPQRKVLMLGRLRWSAISWIACPTLAGRGPLLAGFGSQTPLRIQDIMADLLVEPRADSPVLQGLAGRIGATATNEFGEFHLDFDSEPPS